MKRKYYWGLRFDADGYMSYPDLSLELIDSIIPKPLTIQAY